MNFILFQSSKLNDYVIIKDYNAEPRNQKNWTSRTAKIFRKYNLIIHRIVFFGVILMQFIFVYVIIKVSQYPLLKEIRIFLSDLEAQVLEGTQKLTEMKKYWQRWRIIFAILATLLFYGEYSKRFSLAHKILIL